MLIVNVFLMLSLCQFDVYNPFSMILDCFSIDIRHCNRLFLHNFFSLKLATFPSCLTHFHSTFPSSFQHFPQACNISLKLPTSPSSFQHFLKLPTFGWECVKLG